MKIAVGGDHAGFALKQLVLPELIRRGHEPVDFGSYDPQPVDFPDIAAKVCEAVLGRDFPRGILFCGSGVGAAIACNKTPGIRASVCHDIYTAHQCVEHDDCQIMALGGSIVGPLLALDLIDSFLDAEFSSDPDIRRRVQKLNDMDKR